MSQEFVPGDNVPHPIYSEWSLGQVQTAAGDGNTGNFGNMAKTVINAAIVSLTIMQELQQ